MPQCDTAAFNDLITVDAVQTQLDTIRCVVYCMPVLICSKLQLKLLE